MKLTHSSTHVKNLTETLHVGFYQRLELNTIIRLESEKVTVMTLKVVGPDLSVSLHH